jgi:hypothetical protein
MKMKKGSQNIVNVQMLPTALYFVVSTSMDVFRDARAEDDFESEIILWRFSALCGS